MNSKWEPRKWDRDFGERPWKVMRVVSGEYEILRTKAGKARRFATESAAQRAADKEESK